MAEPSADDWKFRPPGDSAERIIRDREVWFSSPNAFNDPFDCQIDLAGVFRVLESALDSQHLDEVRAIVESAGDHLLSQKYGYFCTCSDWKGTLMWSHYSGNHEGVALGFDFSGGSPFGLTEMEFRLVSYDPEAISAAICRLTDAVNMLRSWPIGSPGLMAGEAQQFQQSVLHAMIGLYEVVRFVKAECWAYEAERRYEIELPRGKCNGSARSFDPRELKHVVFGIRGEQAQRCSLLRLLAAHEWSHVQCWQARPDAVALKVTAERLRRE